MFDCCRQSIEPTLHPPHKSTQADTRTITFQYTLAENHLIFFSVLAIFSCVQFNDHDLNKI